MISRQVTIINRLGLHARAANVLVRMARRYDASIQLSTGERSVDAKSIMGVMTLGAAKGTKVELRAEGSDAEKAVLALEALIKDRFGEEE